MSWAQGSVQRVVAYVLEGAEDPKRYTKINFIHGEVGLAREAGLSFAKQANIKISAKDWDRIAKTKTPEALEKFFEKRFESGSSLSVAERRKLRVDISKRMQGYKYRGGGDKNLSEYAKAHWGDQNVKIVDGGEFMRPGQKNPIMLRGTNYHDRKAGARKSLSDNFHGTGSAEGNGIFFSGPGSYIDSNAYSYNFMQQTFEQGSYGYAVKVQKDGWLVGARLVGDAKIISLKDLKKLHNIALDKGYRGLDDFVFMKDPGRFAASLGFDAIEMKSVNATLGHHYNVLNKRKLIFDARSLPDGEFAQKYKGSTFYDMSTNLSAEYADDYDGIVVGHDWLVES